MKKIVLLGTVLLATGCALQQNNKQSGTVVELIEGNETILVDSSVMQPAIEVAPSNCYTNYVVVNEEPIILKPRVTEEKVNAKVRRCCPEDKLKLEGKTTTVVPDLPEVYVILANRTFDAMLNDISGVFKQDKPAKVYVAKTENTEKDMPGGLAKGEEHLNHRLKNSGSLRVANNKRFADYVITPKVSWYDTTTKTVPAIKYTIEMKSKDGVKIGEWIDIAHQASGDRSWW